MRKHTAVFSNQPFAAHLQHRLDCSHLTYMRAHWCMCDKFKKFTSEHKIRCGNSSLMLLEVNFTAFCSLMLCCSVNGCSYKAPTANSKKRTAELNDPLTHTETDTHVPIPIQDVFSLTPRSSWWLSSFNLTNGFNLSLLSSSLSSIVPVNQCFWSVLTEQVPQQQNNRSRIRRKKESGQNCDLFSFWNEGVNFECRVN